MSIAIKTVIVVTFIIGFPLSASARGLIYGSIYHDGIYREYILHVPATYTGNEPVPLLFNFHGYGGDAISQLVYSDFQSISDNEGFLVVHPEGTLDKAGVAHWNVGGWTTGSTVDDIGFTEALLDALAVEYNIDLTRVYATGMSNGGYMSYLLACQLSNRIAAIASVTGSMTLETYNLCTPQHPTPILQIHGTADSIVPYNGNSLSVSIPDVMNYWVNVNACDPTSQTVQLPDIDPSDGSTVEHIVYEGCADGVAVELFKVIGGSHTWPGTIYDYPGTNYDINASEEIWDFFSRYDINGSTARRRHSRPFGPPD